MRILDRLQDGLGEIFDEITLPERLRSRLDEGGRLLGAGHAAAALDVARAVAAERSGLWRTHVLAGLSLELLGDYTESAAELEKAVQIKDAALARLALGRVYLRLDQPTLARTHFEAALERHPADADRFNALSGIASIHEREDAYAGAIGPLRAALKLVPADDQIRVRLARALLGAGDCVGVVALVESAAAGASTELLRLLAAAYGRRNAVGDTAAAESVLRAILDRLPEDADALEQIADLLLRRGDASGALEQFRRALAVAPVVAHARLLAGVARCHVAAGQSGEALDALRAAVGLGPADLDALAPYATLAVDHGPVDEADEATLRWLAADPRSRRAQALRGRALLRRGDVDEARRVIAPLRAAVMSPEEIDALARLALAVGEPAEALALCGELVAVDPGRTATIAPVRDAAWRELTPTIALPGKRTEWSSTAMANTLDDVAAALTRFARLATQSARIDSIARRLETPLTVAILGEFNAGKSTLINAYLGENIVPVGVLPTTSRVNVIAYGPRPVAQIRWSDGESESLPASQARERLKASDRGVERLDFEWPHPELRAVHLWDTPGFNAPDTQHESEALRALSEADAIVWLVDATQALSATELDRVRQVADAPEKLLVAINKIDRLDSDPDAQKAIGTHVENALGGQFAAMVFLSARQALQARIDDNAAALKASGWPEFDAAIREHLFDRAGRIKALEAAAALGRELRGLLAQARALVATTQTQAGRLADLRRDSQGWADRFEARAVTSTLHNLTGSLQKARADAAAEVAVLVRGTGSLLARPRIGADEAAAVMRHLRDASLVAFETAVSSIESVVDELRTDTLLVTEHVCAVIGGDEARVMRRRVESFSLAEAAAIASLRDRACNTSIDVISALIAANGDDAVAAACAESARGLPADGAFAQLVAAPSEQWRDRLVAWGRSWAELVLTLIGRMERDLEQVALDVERRIIQPLLAVLEALEPRAAAEMSANEPADDRA